MNILTFDIEEWYLEKRNKGNRAARIALYDRLLGEILDLLDERGLKATFFCVGGMAVDFPQVVRLIDSRGHEIGCHSMRHTWLNKMSRSETLEDSRQAVDALEQCIGKKIVSYRAPAFSIGEGNKWAFEVLARCGIERDSSVFPAARDFGGFPNFGHKTPVIVECEGIQIKEFPICTARVLGKELAYSGGGYFRFFPLWFVQREIRRSDYTMCYFHLADLINEHSHLMSKQEFESYFKETGALHKRCIRYFKDNYGMSGAYNKMRSLIINNKFNDLRQIDKETDWTNIPIAHL